MELFTFLQMGGALERIDVRRLGDDQNVLRQLGSWLVRIWWYEQFELC